MQTAVAASRGLTAVGLPCWHRRPAEPTVSRRGLRGWGGGCRGWGFPALRASLPCALLWGQRGCPGVPTAHPGNAISSVSPRPVPVLALAMVPAQLLAQRGCTTASPRHINNWSSKCIPVPEPPHQGDRVASGCCSHVEGCGGAREGVGLLLSAQKPKGLVWRVSGECRTSMGSGGEVRGRDSQGAHGAKRLRSVEAPPGTVCLCIPGFSAR